MGIYLYDAFGNLELLYRDPEISSGNPIPVRAAAQAAGLRGRGCLGRPAGGRASCSRTSIAGLAGIPRGTVKQLRIVAVPPKVQPHMNNPNLGVSAEDPGKFVLGTVPVEADGSAHFRVPSGVSVFFQALDENGLAVQTMRSLTYVQPEQTLSCVGCHESRELAPPIQQGPAGGACASRRGSRPGPAGSWPLRFDRLVQPVLDRHCAECHAPTSTHARAVEARSDRRQVVPEPAVLRRRGPQEAGLRARPLDPRQGHRGQQQALCTARPDPAATKACASTPRASMRLVTWMDTYAQRQGHFSEAQERELEKIRQAWGELFVAGPPAGK